MANNRSYTVQNPSILFTLPMCLIIAFLGMAVIYLCVTPQADIRIVICLLVVMLPFAVLAVWAKRYRIEVKGTSITLHKSLLLKPRQFDVADITKAVYIISQTRAGVNTKLTIHTSSCGRFTVESLMVNSKKLLKLIDESVSKDKIQVIRKSFVK